MIYENTEDLIGKTPLIHLKKFEERHNLSATVLVKAEQFNLGGSIKDRVAKAMLDNAEAAGTLKPGGTVIEPTSGNTGIGLALLAALRGYKAIIVMPDTMSIERRNLIKAYGAETVLSDGKQGMSGAIAKAEELAASIPGSLIAGQFVNPSNSEAHYLTTGPEIWEDTEGRVDILIAGVGTGGTITGAGRFLKEKNPRLKVIAVEPAASPVLSEGKAGPHAIQGIGAGFVSEILDKEIYDEVICVGNEDAMIFGREAACKDGLLVGISSGAALKAAAVTAAKPENKGKRIVVILPDTGERYLSTAMFTQA